MNRPSIAIVIPVHNEAEMLPACIRGVLRTVPQPDVRIIVVDDGSSDGAVDRLPDDPRIEVIRRSERGGVAAALNTGFAAAPNSDIVRLHADVVVETAGWLERLTEAAYAGQDRGAIGVRLVYPDGRIESEGRALVSGFGFNPWTHALRAFQPEHVAGGRREVDSVSGALTYLRRAAIDAVGGLDGRYGPAWTEDDDFCFAARRRGFDIWVEPAVRAVHYTRAYSPGFEIIFPNTGKVLTPLTQTFKQSARKLQAEIWETKWGWNPLHPDLNEVRRLYGRTKVCWQIGEPMRYRPTGEFPAVDCCLVTWNSLHYLKRTLASLEATDYPRERMHVYVVDNGSTDGTGEFLAQYAAAAPYRVTVLGQTTNLGVAAGMNVAIQAGRSELVARLDDDIVLPPGWLQLLRSDLVARPFAGCVGLKTVNDDDRRSLQWAMERDYPQRHNHENEPDAGQADFLGRVWHAAGCSCLYRRDVFARCGLLDIRYSPTQVDDVDHCISLVHAGYEVLCDGRLSVIHKKTSGLDRSLAAMGSAKAHWYKMVGKWGNEIYETLDTALALSREGYALPDDGDTSAWMDRGPAAECFPRAATADASANEFIAKLYLTLNAPLLPGSDFHKIADDYTEMGRARLQEDNFTAALTTLITTLNFAPTHVAAFRVLGRLCERNGQAAAARAVAVRGLHLAPGDRELETIAALTAEGIRAQEAALRAAVMAPRNLPPPAVRSRQTGLKVLLVGNFVTRPGAADIEHLKSLQTALAAEGAAADACCVPRPDSRGYDVVHLFGSAQTYENLMQATAVRVADPQVPLVLTPFFGDVRDAQWCGSAMATILSRQHPALVEQGLNELAAGRLVLPTGARPDRNRLRMDAGDPRKLQARLFALADRIVTFSTGEYEALQRSAGRDFVHAVIAAGVSPVAPAADPSFAERFGLTEFVLMVGTVEPASNQLALLHALRGSPMPVVVVGPHVDVPYLQACRQHAPARSLFLPELPPELTASAYRSAKVVASPAHFDPSLASIAIGAVAGCGLALNERLPGREAFAGVARTFHPDQPASIRTAVQTAWIGLGADPSRRRALADELATGRNWAAVAAAHLELYRRLLIAKGAVVPELESNLALA